MIKYDETVGAYRIYYPAEDVAVTFCYSLSADGSVEPTTAYDKSAGIAMPAEPLVLKAVAKRTGFDDSRVTTFAIEKVATPTFSLVKEDFSISCTTPDATIYYTTDGSNPTKDSEVYTDVLNAVDLKGKPIKAMAVKPGHINSDVADYGVLELACMAPDIIRKNRNSILFATPYPADAIVRYTINGSTPDASSAVYTGAPIVLADPLPVTVKVYATATSYTDSPVKTFTIVESDGTEENPYFISSSADFTDFVAKANDSGSSAHYCLTEDITADGAASVTTAFTGVFDGNFHVISNLSRPLVDRLSGSGTIKNVTLDNVNVSGANVGAICNEADGSARIYNCGVLGGTVSGSGAVGGIVGLIAEGSSVRVVNCYNYATIAGGTHAAGIVGLNNGTVDRTTNTGVRIAMCMMYGDITAGTCIAPVYVGSVAANTTYGVLANTHQTNVQQFNEYNYYRSRASLDYTAGFYNEQLAIDKDIFITRFPFYRHIMNTHRELAAYFLFGTSGQTAADMTTAQIAEIGHWALKDDVAKYPIIEAWQTNTQRTTVDIAANLPSTTEKFAGKLLNNIADDGYYDADGNALNAMGTAGYLTVNYTIDDVKGSIDLPITDMDTLRYDYTWGKVVLPFANEFVDWRDKADKDYSKVITGWKITSVTGGTAGTLDGTYNFADRNCTAKDIYNATTNPYIFAQGGNYIVPYGVTEISIEANFAKAFYLSDPSYDVGFDAGYSKTTVQLAGAVKAQYHGQTVYTDISTLVAALATTQNPNSQAIVLVGNYHYFQMSGDKKALFNTGKAVSVMSVDEDSNQEPDYGWYSYHTIDRTEIPPIRFDFVPNIGMGMAKRITGSQPYPTIGIWHAKGWFELTETALSFMSECEINSNKFSAADNSHGNNRWIANSGYFIQIVRCRSGNCDKLSFIQLGGNAFVEELYPGCHTDNNYKATLVPVNVTGGEVKQCFMTGYRAGSTCTGKEIRFWCSGGRIHKYLSAYIENPNNGDVNVTARVDHALIRRFFGGGTSTKAQITGNINVTINNSKVDFYCGGPEFGDMSAGKTVTTNATGTTFGQYYGAGFGGTSITRNRTGNNTGVDFSSDKTYPLGFDSYTGNRLKYDANLGIGCNYSFEYILYAGGGGTGVARFYTGYADFSLAKTRDVVNNLNGCTIVENFYGGGCQGMVDGTITSTLTDCTVNGSAFGGGYKPASTTVEVYPTTQPTYSVYKKEMGLFTDFGTTTPEIFTWMQGSKGASDANSKVLYTDVDLTTSGQVTGAITLTLAGSTTVGGDVFGGGNESKSLSTTTVIIK